MVRVLTLLALLLFVAPPIHAMEMEKDVLKTSAGDLGVTFVGHGTLMLEFGNKVFHVDPWSKLTDYTKLPKADAVLITHEHYDHLDPSALDIVRTKNTVVLCTEKCKGKVQDGIVMKNGDIQNLLGVQVEAVPAYNLVHKGENGKLFHPKGEGNGYVFIFGDTRLYIAGDTENTPEMKALKAITYAFLPMNLPYTMTPEMLADAAKAFRPKVLYPYHYGDTDTNRIAALLKDEKDIEVRIRRMQ